MGEYILRIFEERRTTFRADGPLIWAPRWAYTLLGALFLIGSMGPIVSMRYGIAWRQAQKAKADRKKQEKQARMEARAAH
jgi:hypothetical protein